MEISLQKVVAIVIASAGALGAMTASADVVLPSTGNGELTLFVRDTVTGNVYVRGIQVTLDNIATEATTGGAYSGPTQIATNVSMTHDANFTAFMATTTGHEVLWGVQTADTVGGNNPTAPKRVAFTTNDDLIGTGFIPGNAQISNASGTVGQLLSAVNDLSADPAGSSLFGVDNLGGQWGNPGTLGDGAEHVFTINANNAAALGSTQAFYLATTQTGNNGAPGRLFTLSGLTLNANGDLSTVPLPAAAWLLGSGLIGLAGIGRRRRAQVVTA